MQQNKLSLKVQLSCNFISVTCTKFNFTMIAALEFYIFWYEMLGLSLLCFISIQMMCMWE